MGRVSGDMRRVNIALRVPHQNHATRNTRKRRPAHGRVSKAKKRSRVSNMKPSNVVRHATGNVTVKQGDGVEIIHLKCNQCPEEFETASMLKRHLSGHRVSHGADEMVSVHVCAHTRAGATYRRRAASVRVRRVQPQFCEKGRSQQAHQSHDLS
jgi:hypothetical protein